MQITLNTRRKGFTLTELMVALAIVAVVSAIAVPLYTQYSQRSYITEVQADLMNCSQALERWSALNFTYAGTADTNNDGVGDANAGPIAAEVCVAQAVLQDRYAITINAPGNTSVLTATPDAAGPVAGTGFMTIDNAGNRTWDDDGDGDDTDAGDDNWIKED